MNPPTRAERRDSWILKFHDLMPHRIREVLLVSSDYDAYVIEEDGRLSERLFVEYSELNLTTSPRFLHVSEPEEAMQLLRQRRVDLVLTTLRLDDPGVRNLAERVKSEYPNLPVALMVLDEFEVRRLPHRQLPGGLDGVFLWTGDTRIMLAILKLIEDSLNVAEDTARTGVQVIIVVEDSVRRYSTFLAQLYAELMIQSQSLVAEGVNAMHRMLRMMARPKILLATDYEQAWVLFERFQRHTLAVISDVQYPRRGQDDALAGFELARAVRAVKPNLPILIQSANPENAQQAHEMGLQFVDKNSETLLRSLTWFLKENLGFSDFVFRLPDRTEVARARDMYELEQVLRKVDVSSVFYHASRNHFNVWLRARSMFELADEVEAVQASAFADPEQLRQYLVGALHRAACQEQEGVVADFSRRSEGPTRHFVKIGGGSIGGKGRGVAFLNSRLARRDLDSDRMGMAVAIPRTVVIGTDEFDRFLEHNGLGTLHASRLPEEEVQRRFLEGELPRSVAVDLRAATREMRGPLAVRSSSLLEDSQHQSCAGIYATRLLSNNHPDPEVRFRHLSRAIRMVYASTWSARARAYLENTPFSVEEEKMAVVIQEVVGQARGGRFYPDFAGVALSYNYYPVGPQQPDDGVVLMALGLGHTVAEGGLSIRFSPKWPEVLPHLASPTRFLRYSQRRFYAVDLSGRQDEGSEALVQFGLEEAEEDGSLALAGSVYSIDDDQLRENLGQVGPRAVTFNNILKWGSLPFAEAMRELLPRLQRSMGCPVEVEFAVDIGDLGQRVASGQVRREPTLYLLQIRPLSGPSLEAAVEAREAAPERILCQSTRSLGHGLLEDVRDVVFVWNDVLSMPEMKVLAEEVGGLTQQLFAKGRPYLLIGPGRWGSSDPSLGIPIETSQVLGARAVVELPFGDREVEPSQGSHFFHELTSMRIGYLTLSREEAEAFDRDWLLIQPIRNRTRHLVHIRMERPLSVILDGRRRQGTILKPAPAEEPAGVEGRQAQCL